MEKLANRPPMILRVFAMDYDLSPGDTTTVMVEAEDPDGDRLSFHGAIDIQHTLPHGTPEEVQAEVQERCRVLGRGGGYICASAHYIQADTPLENIIALYTAPREI
ncbi:MAG: hypothetical protein ONB06_02130 [candidate division KSB1 bacterium]|nr:hypothetical protein [candidate division KSB1 bacterium]